MRKHKSTPPVQEIKNPFAGKNPEEVWEYIHANLQGRKSEEVRQELINKLKGSKS